MVRIKGIHHKGRYWLLWTGLSALVTALIVFVPAIIRDKGFFLIVDDFNAQQMTFATAVRCALQERPLGDWYWGIDLGTSLVNTFSFYNLGSPFFWISMLFPNVLFPYLAGWLYVLKYVTAALTAHLYLRRFLKDERYAVIGALLYAFSGFQTTNLMFFHFHEVVAFFPLLLLGLEKVMEDKKHRPFFIFTVFLNCFVNYFFFIGEVIFLIPYFLLRFHGRSIKELLKATGSRLLDGVLGVGMAFVLFLPSVMYVLDSARSEFSLTSADLFYKFKDLLVILKGLFLPGDLMNDGSALLKTNWNSTSAYLPLFGLSFVIAYLIRQKGWLRILLIGGLVFCFVPGLQSMFYLFTSVYQRWWYMLVLLFVLATVKVLEEPGSYRIGLGACLNGAIAAALYLVVRFLYRNGSGDPFVFHNLRFLLAAIVAVVSPLLVWGLIKLRLLGWKRLAVLTMVFCCTSTGLVLHAYRKLNTNRSFRSLYEDGLLMDKIDDQYRYRASGILMTANGKSAAYIGFCSTLENSTYRFNELFDIHSTNMTNGRTNVSGLAALLGAKFRITKIAEEEGAVKYVENKGTSYYVVTYTKTCPIGFALDRYQTADQLKTLPVNERASALMHAFVIEPNEIEKVKQLAEPFDPDGIDLRAKLVDSIDRCRENAVFDFHRDNTGFRCRTAYDRDRFVYFTVPYDKGWHASIDGEPAEILCSGGMMLLRVPKGEHDVRFLYHTPGLRIGAIVSAVSWLIFIGLCILCRVARKRGGARSGRDPQLREGGGNA